MYPLDCADCLLVDVDDGKRGAGDRLDGRKKKNDDGVKGGKHGGVRVGA